MNGYIATAINELMSKSIFSWSSLEGNFAEVGVLEGNSASVIITFVPNGKILYLYDTFNGIPYHDEKYDNHCRKGNFSVSIDSVKKKMEPYHDKARIIPGIFPQSAYNQKNEIFCFANIDVDVYKSTMDSLEFFYPRTVRGGLIMIQDDYKHPHTLGVASAADEFIANKLEEWIIYKCIAYFVKE